MTKQRSFYLYFFAICLVQFFSQFANTTQGALLSSHISFYSLESASQGLINTAQSIGGVLVTLILIFLSGRISNHRIILFSVALECVALALMSFSPSLWVMLLFYIAFGMGFGSLSSVCASQASLLFPGKISFMGLMHSCFGLGGLLGPFVHSALLLSLGGKWNWVYVPVAVAALLVTLIFAFSGKSCGTALDTLETDQQKAGLKDVGVFFKSKLNLLLLLGMFGYSAMQNGYNVWIIRFFENKLNAPGLAPAMLSLFWAGNTIARFVVPRLPIRPERSLCTGCILAFASTIAGAVSGNAVIMAVCTCITGIVSGASFPQFYHLVCQWNPHHTLMASSITTIIVYASWTLTSPITAYFNGNGLWTLGMIMVGAYAFIGGCAMLPTALKKQN